MKTYPCACGATLFFNNVACDSCGREVGWCDACHTISARSSNGACENPGCGAAIADCSNRTQHRVCNGFALADQPTPFCYSCQLTQLAPDASVPENARRWALLEAGKRRLLYDLRLVGLDHSRITRDLPLRFHFPADTPTQHFVTGHADGLITINLVEADPVEREKSRQNFGEPQRTIIGHFRHEVGHYLFSLLVENQREAGCIDVFGDHNNPSYAEAMPRYYQQGPPDDWQQRFVSQYASSHPWEDFAETVGFYLDMRSVLDTLSHQTPNLAPPEQASFDQVLTAYLRAGVALNEVNRTMGLTDLVPEVISNPVIEKLRFIDGLLGAQ